MPQTTPALLTTRDVAQLLGVSSTRVRQLIAEREDFAPFVESRTTVRVAPSLEALRHRALEREREPRARPSSERMTDLTEQQQAALDEVRELSPVETVDVAANLGISASAARSTLKRLEARGLIESSDYQRRATVWLVVDETRSTSVLIDVSLRLTLPHSSQRLVGIPTTQGPDLRGPLSPSNAVVCSL